MALNERGQVAGLSGDGTVNGSNLRVFLWQNGRMQTRSVAGMPAYHVPPALNDRGEIAWTTWITRGTRNAVLSRNGRSTVLAADDGARALNNQGQVMLESRKLWQRGQTVDLDPLDGYALNDAGQVVGSIGSGYKDPGDYQYSDCWRAAVWDSGAAVELGGIGLNSRCDIPPHGNSMALAINSKGVIAGYSDAGAKRAVVWTPRTGAGSR